MSYLALYRKYRPQTFDELAGQNFIVKILKNSIINEKISHAYLFYGPRGTGKTSVAKLLAKIVNCENLKNFTPCNECASCKSFVNKNNPDVIEIDAASNNGVDEIREIRNNVGLLPSISKYKVYIIDEVHMLSSGAFNALLKTLEEPPKHAIFVLATTEFYKVPETIVSRCQCFEFSRISEDKIVDRLKYICENEKIAIDDNVLQLIAHYSDGGLRDAISLLDKLSCYTDHITADDFYELRGVTDNTLIHKLVENIIDKNVKDSLDLYNELVKKGKNILLLAEDMLVELKNIIIDNSKNGVDNSYLYKLINIIQNDLNIVKSSNTPKIIFEITLLKMMNLDKNDNKIISREIILENKCIDDTKKEINQSKNNKNSENEKKIQKNIVEEKSNDLVINNAFALADKLLLNDMKNKWSNFSDYLHNKEFASVVSYFIDGNIRVAGSKDVIISVMYDSIAVNASLNINKLELLFNLVMGSTYHLVFVTEEEWKNLKKNFIESKKLGKNYIYIEENVNKCDTIKKEVTKSDSSSVNDAIVLFGTDVVEVE